VRLDVLYKLLNVKKTINCKVRYIYILQAVAYAENFRRGQSFVTIVWRKSTLGEAWPGAYPRETFAKLHLKIRNFVHSGSKSQCNAFTRLISRWGRKLNFCCLCLMK